MASKSIYKLDPLRPASASPNLLDHGLRVYPWGLVIVIARGTSKLGKIECGLCIMRCLSNPGSPKYILPVAESISDMPVTLNVYIKRY
jgi:hypothetical protein